MDPDPAVADSLLASARVLVAMAIRTVGDGPRPLTLVQHRVLLLLEEAGGLSVNDVAARLGVNQSNASRHCTRLTELGLVDRRPAPGDGRSVDLRLTDSGRRQVLAVRRARRTWVESVLARLTDEQAHEVAHGLELFAMAAGAVDSDASAGLL